MTVDQTVKIAALIIGAICGQASAQSQRTEHTLGLDDPAVRPAATLADVAWLVGSWEGEAFGSQFEEVWNPASAGSMAGFFKLMKDGEVVFYEMLVLVEEEGSINMKVKHFQPDFTAWEDKAEYITFRLVDLQPDAVHFSGLSFFRRDPDHLDGFIAMRSNGEVKEEKLVYRRVKP